MSLGMTYLPFYMKYVHQYKSLLIDDGIVTSIYIRGFQESQHSGKEKSSLPYTHGTKV